MRFRWLPGRLERPAAPPMVEVLVNALKRLFAIASGRVSAIKGRAMVLFRPVLRIDEFASARPDAAHLQDSLFFDFNVVRHIRGLGIEAAGRQDLQIGGVEPLTIAGCEGPGEYRDL